MRILANQVDGLRTTRNAALAARFAPSVRGDLPPVLASLPEDAMVSRIARVIAAAQDYGLRRDKDLRAFVRLHFAVGPAFDRHPPFAAILRDPQIPDEARMAWLFGAARASDWDAAAAQGHHAA